MAQLSLATSSVRISGYRLVQTVQDLAYIYIPEGQAHVEFCASLNCVNVPSNMYTQASPVETKLQRTGTWSATAWQIPCLCYRPLVAFLHHCLIALSLPQWKIRTFYKKMSGFFKYTLPVYDCNSGKVCVFESTCSIHVMHPSKTSFDHANNSDKEDELLSSLLLASSFSNKLSLGFKYSCHSSLAKSPHSILFR